MLLRPARAARGLRPTGSVQLNRDSPQARGLQRLWPLLGDARQLVAGLGGTTTYDGTAAYKGATLGGLALDTTAGDLNTGEQIQPLFSAAVEISIVWWAFPTTAFNDSAVHFWWGQHGAAAPEFSAQHYLDNNFYVGGTDVLEARVAIAATATNWIQNQWQCYTFTVDGVSTSVRLYQNGLEIGNNFPFTTAPSALVSGNFILGNSQAGAGNNFAGSLAHFAIYNRVLTPMEVWQAYDPATRWDLYWVPSSRTFFDVGAVAAPSFDWYQPPSQPDRTPPLVIGYET